MKKHKLYARPVITASADYNVPEPHISKLVLFVVRIVGRIYFFFVLGITKIVIHNGNSFYRAYKRALEEKSRCIIAFRHSAGIEPQILMWFILFNLRAKAKKAGITFCRKPYVSFVYGYEVLRWGGSVLRWAMPGLRAMPVHHSKLDSAGMNRIFQTVTDGPYPLAIAPEGQVSYATESIPRLEQGTVRIGFRAAEQLEKNGKTCSVEILPVSVHLRFGKNGGRTLEKLIQKTEKYTGFRQDGAGITERLKRSRDFILEQNEKRYGIIAENDWDFAERINKIMEAALSGAEKIMGCKAGSNDIFDRLYFIRQICWDKMVIPGIFSLNHLSPLERALADLGAGEAWHASRHMELVDFSWYFRIPVPEEESPLHIKIEYAQNLWDFANRTMGGAFPNRVFNVHPKQVIIETGSLINLSERLTDYKENKKSAAANALKDLETAFLDCIDSAEKY